MRRLVYKKTLKNNVEWNAFETLKARSFYKKSLSSIKNQLLFHVNRARKKIEKILCSTHPISLAFYAVLVIISIPTQINKLYMTKLLSAEGCNRRMMQFDVKFKTKICTIIVHFQWDNVCSNTGSMIIW